MPSWRVCRQLSHVLLLLFWSSAVSAQEFTGFWKEQCEQAFGLQIMPAGEGLYSVSFCGPGGCFEPDTYRPNTPIVGDDNYQVISDSHIRVLGHDGWSDYYKCDTDTHPELRYRDCDDRAEGWMADGGKRGCAG